jgi:hypothetical protein
MNIDEVISVNKIVWKNYLNKVTKIQPKTATFLYPTIMLVTEVDNFFIVELIGFSERHVDLNVKKNKAENLDSYIYQFNYESSIKTDKSTNINSRFFTRIYLGAKIEEEILNERFFFQERWPTKIVASDKIVGTNKIFNFGCINYLEYNDSCIANKLSNIYRLKPILHLHCIAKHITKHKYKKHLINQLSGPLKHSDDLKGVLYSDSKYTSTNLIYSQFLNVYSFTKLRETTIGEFLNKNTEIIKGAFNSNNVLYEPEFEWIEGNPEDSEKSIKPDFMIESAEDNWDILDLKLPYWSKSKLTKGPRKRRSFLQIVDDAIAQLANYEDYFSFEKNKEFSKKKYGVVIKNPRLIVVIGNFNNYNQAEIDEASRKLKDNFMIIDYDTLNFKYYQSAVYFA